MAKGGRKGQQQELQATGGVQAVHGEAVKGGVMKRQDRRKRTEMAFLAPKRVNTVERHKAVLNTPVFMCIPCVSRKLGTIEIHHVYQGQCSNCPRFGPIVRVV